MPSIRLDQDHVKLVPKPFLFLPAKLLFCFKWRRLAESSESQTPVTHLDKNPSHIEGCKSLSSWETLMDRALKSARPWLGRETESSLPSGLLCEMPSEWLSEGDRLHILQMVTSLAKSVWHPRKRLPGNWWWWMNEKEATHEYLDMCDPWLKMQWLRKPWGAAG